MFKLVLCAGLVYVFSLSAWEDPRQPAKPEAAKLPAARSNPSGLNKAASVRNENVSVQQIDNDVLKAANIRLGDNVTIVPQPPVEANHYATEHGQPAGEIAVLRPASPFSGFHGELFEFLRNSIFNARTFFQVGAVQPSRQNSFGGRFSGRLKGIGVLTGSISDLKVRGMVNGNVLVPLASERTPLATDPAVRAVVSRFLAAYPAELPNRPDFDPRALNTNSPQRIDQADATLRLDRDLDGRSRLSLSHTLSRQRTDAFQLVAGQNPDTEIHSHRSRLTWRRALSDATEAAVGLGFTRVKSVLLPEPNAVGPRVRLGYQIEELGPDSMFPVNRAQNTYRWGVLLSQRAAGGRHTLTYGADASRFQLNGVETNNSRGQVWFSNNFGRSAIENFRLGIPTTYEVTLGEMDRGFRNWGANFFVADQWKAGARLQIYYGIRYNLVTAPTEVNNVNQIPYGCDCNNFSPRFSIAYRLPGEWVIRTGYTVSFGEIPPVSYQQVRYNLPYARYLQVQDPGLLDPLRGINLNDPNGRSSPTNLSPDLVSPYSHQYNFNFERRLAQRGGSGYLLRIGYIGSRSFKLIDSMIENRAEHAAGVASTTANVDLRRPDPRYFEVKNIVNFGTAYMDAAQVTMEAPYRNGLTWGATYTFGKALDAGSDYSGTGANKDQTRRNQWQYEAFRDKKGLSNFDSTHSLLFYYSYDVPRISAVRGPVGWIADGWQLSGSMLAKTGTPLTLFIGSDAPGFGNVDGGPSDRPNIVDPSILGRTIGNPDTAPQILRRDRFAYMSLGEVRGSLARNAFRKGGINNFNAAVSKQWRWGGRSERTVLFRAEAFNLANHPQFDEPQRNLSSPAFGKITNTLNDGRVLQFGIRFMM